MSVPSINLVDINSFRAPFTGAYEGSINGLWFNDVAKIYPTNSMVGVYPALGAAVGLKAWSGARQGQKPLPFKLTLTSAPFEASVIYPVDNFKTDTIGVFNDNILDMASKAAWHYNWAVRDFLKVGHSTDSFDSLWDGSTAIKYFSTSHPYGFDATGASPTGTQSNLLTANAAGTTGLTSLAIVNKDKPTVSEAATIIQDVTAAMLGFVDLNGDQINGTMRAIDIFVGDAPKFTAYNAAVNLLVIPNSGGAALTNPVVGFQNEGFKYRVIYEPGLTGDSVYFLRADGNVKPILIQETSGIEIQALGPTSEYAIQNNNVLFGVKKVCAVGPLLYTSAVKATHITHS